MPRQPEVFVSSPATLTPAQRGLQRKVLDDLVRCEFKAIRIERAQYVPTPWEQLRELVASCDGAIVLGFGQLHVELGEWRPGTPESRPAAGLYATAWNQIEAGLAIMARVPVLVTVEAQVTGGVFSTDVWGEDVFGLRLGDEAAGEESARATIEAWAGRVSARALLSGG